MKNLELIDDNKCFACGMNNPEGLRIVWKVDGKVMRAKYAPEEKYQGWKGIVHGGLLATLLDEAMTRLASIFSQNAVTAEMTVRYLLPAKVGETLFIEGEILLESKKILEMRASLRKGSFEGTLIAKAQGKAIKIL